MKLSSLISSTAVALTLLGAGGASAASLVVNGSFENPNLTSGTWSTYSSILGWSSTNGIEIRDNAVGTAYDGQNFVELDTDRNSTMWQSIATSAGQLYELKFAYSPRINQPQSTNGISAYWNNQLLQNVASAGGSSNNWTLYSFFVTGTGGSDTLKFSATGTSDSLGGNLDAVSLNAVPLPGAALLFGSSLLGFLGFSNRRKV